ncbi:MAG TPA: LytTR family DNA-binding domain-containing protein [Caulobacteraceae bacterium]|jgi:DNA-binding LytR/AlgR family response regulator|nr:LytTR family DNA-binding domain-containing protein [Caulobacteraceae bacterium]
MSEDTRLFGAPREWAKDLAIATAIGVFFGVIGPFGSFLGGPIELRIAYWVANMWIGFIMLTTIVRLAVRVAEPLDLPIWFVLAVGAAIGVVPLAIVLAYFSALVWPPNHGHVASLFNQYGEALAISEPFVFGYYFLLDRGWTGAVRGARPAPRDAAPDAVADPRDAPRSEAAGFLDRLPPRLGRDLLCLQMEDHYVRAHTARGSDLILTPLKDAIAELGGTEGLQVHRSWWVAKAAVSEPVSSGRNLVLRLSNGLEVPVSRASVAKLRAAGWLADA